MALGDCPRSELYWETRTQMHVMMLIRVNWNHSELLNTLGRFEIFREYLILFGTIWDTWDHLGPFGTIWYIWNHLELLMTMWNYLAPIRTIWGRLGPFGTI